MENTNYEEEFFDDMEDFEMEEKKSVMDKVKGFGRKVSDKAKSVIDDVKENPGQAAEKAFEVATTAVTVGLIVAGISDAKKRSRTVYSGDIGETVLLKKKLTNKDKIEIDYRMKNGETKIEAMDNLDLIKK